MRIPQAPLFEYMYIVVNPNLRLAFMNQIKEIHHANIDHSYSGTSSSADKRSQFYFEKRNISINIDGSGQKISKGHELYELSDAILKFNEGSEINLSVKKDNQFKETFHPDLEQFFSEKGLHFCAGYLSQYGDIVATRTNFPIAKRVSDMFLKMIHAQPYTVARKVYETKLKSTTS